MRIAIYGGSFNPPHLGHAEVARSVVRDLSPDKFLIIPDNIPPHKEMEQGSPSAEERFQLCKAAFSQFDNVEISSVELEREGKSYTSDTIKKLREIYDTDELFLVIGTDMLLSFESWHEFGYILSQCTLTVLSRCDGDQEKIEMKAKELKDKYHARIQVIPHSCIDISSSEIRAALKSRGMSSMTSDEVYTLIIKNRFYSSAPDLVWLRKKAYEYLDKKRIPHVAGCEQEAKQLSKRWGENEGKAAEAAILHDITKKLRTDEQLKLLRKYGIVCDNEFLGQAKLFHAATGAGFARELFGITSDVYNAIFFHTTAKPAMAMLEKIIYLADYVEPTRDFEGVECLRKLCYENIDMAMEFGLKMSIDDLQSRGIEPYSLSVEAYKYYHNLNMKDKL